jgi:hypothetical protein
MNLDGSFVDKGPSTAAAAWDAHATLVGDVRVPDGLVGVDSDAVRSSSYRCARGPLSIAFVRWVAPWRRVTDHARDECAVVPATVTCACSAHESGLS